MKLPWPSLRQLGLPGYGPTKSRAYRPFTRGPAETRKGLRSSSRSGSYRNTGWPALAEKRSLTR
eukprot:2079844-Lingulodinium_polyedra.AAC.1